MFEWFESGGVMMYPLLIVLLVVVGLVMRSGWELHSGPERPGPRLRANIDAVLFWGVFALVLGALGTLVGITQAAQAIQLSGSVEPVLVWGGIGVSLVTTIAALLILAFAALAWMGLRASYRRRAEAV